LDVRLVLPAVAAWVVAWQVRVLPPAPVLCLALALLLAAPAALRWVPAHGATWAAVLVCAAAAGVATAARTGARADGPVPDLAGRGAVATVEAVVTADPRLVPGGRGPTAVVPVRVERITWGGTTTRVRSPVLVLSQDQAWLPLLPSQRVRVVGKLMPAEAGDAVSAVLSGRGPPEVLSPPSRIQRVAGHLRSGLREACEPLPDAAGGLLPGLVVGDTGRLLPETRQDFTTVGLTHLTAVSGTNVAVLLAAVLALARLLRLGLRGTPLLGGLALLAFVVLARPSPSVLRAGAMGVVALLALATGGRRRAVPALSAAVLVLVLLTPDLAASPGFALSVLATAGLLVLGPPLRDALARRVPGAVADALAIPMAAQLACGPVVVALSGNLGLLSVPANLLAEAAVAPATVLGVAVALVAAVWMPGGQALAWVAWLPTEWLVQVAHIGARLPGAHVGWPDGQRGALLLAGVTLLGYPVMTRPRARRLVLTVLVAVALAVGALQVLRPSWPPVGWLLVMCDVGQGDGLVVRTGPREALVIDAGPDPERMDRCLDRLGIQHVPMVVLTHPHADHVAGLPGVLRGRSVGLVEVGPSDDPPAQAARVEEWARAAGIPVVRGVAGEHRVQGGVTWTVLGPRRTYLGTDSDPNNESLVLRLTSEGVTFLLTGDIEPEAQADLLASDVDLRADVLKVPHHGSAHQDPEFLAAVGARVALTSVGAGNDYGHPAASTLDELRSEGAQTLRTDLDGPLAVAVRDGRLVVVPGGP
jgi:competence protein ComEC